MSLNLDKLLHLRATMEVSIDLERLRCVNLEFRTRAVRCLLSSGGDFRAELVWALAIFASKDTCVEVELVGLKDIDAGALGLHIAFLLSAVAARGHLIDEVDTRGAAAVNLGKVYINRDGAIKVLVAVCSGCLWLLRELIEP